MVRGVAVLRPGNCGARSTQCLGYETGMTETPQVRVYTGLKAWDVIWKWSWFAGLASPSGEAKRVLHPVLSQLGVNTLLDCSCGLGNKTQALAELGYQVEGSDGSRAAIKYATALATDRGQDLRFFRSSWEKLGDTAGRKYDCVLNDSIEWCPTRAALRSSVQGIHSVLHRGGTFLFQGSNQTSRDTDAESAEEIKKEGRFQTLPVHERDGMKLTVLISRERIPDGILGNRIHIVEEADSVRVEVASVPDIRRWTWPDYVDVLDDAGFRDVRTLRSSGTDSLNVATK